MSMSVLQDHYVVLRGHSGGGIHAFIILGRGDVHKIAYRTEKMTRWKIGAPMGLKTAEILVDKCHRDVQRGYGYVGFIHDVRRHQRENIRDRFKRHRKAMQVRREMKAIEALPTFGMF